MAVTLQQIADMAGVSRGTVDRALNNRGRIRPEVAEKIRNIAKELGYQPSRAGRALSIARKNLKIGVIVQMLDTPFMQDVLNGVHEAKQEAESLGATVEVHQIEKVDPMQVVEIMQDMQKRQINGIALSPTVDGYLIQTINQFVEEYNIPILTFNLDLENSARFCFIGQDACRSGQTAAGLMGEIVDGRGQIVVISGREENMALRKRAAGFIQEIKKTYPKIEVLGTRYAYDDNWVAEKITEDVLDQVPYLKGIYITGAGVRGVCRAVKDARREDTVKIIANDLIEENVNYLKDGTINFLIGQDAYAQGYKSIMILLHKLLDGKEPDGVMQYTDIVIKNRYNL